jgi:hypothetical protein
MEMCKSVKVKCADQGNYVEWSSSSFTLRKLECLKQPLGALNTLAWDNRIGFGSYNCWFERIE